MGVLIPLVARAGVLAEVGSVLTAARAGRGALLTVTGEPGIGKTRLAEEAAERAEGFEVVWTWGAAAGGAALGPWSRVLRVLAGRHAAVARLIADSPFLAGLTDPARAGGGRDPGGARSQLSFDLAEVIAAAAAARPVLVVFDDAHQADTSSLRLLAELAPALRTMPAAVLVTARDGDRDWHGRLDMRTALLRSGDVISLQPLAEGDVAAVVAGVTGAPAGPDLVGVIAERSAGNPFLVTELARQLGGRNAEPAAARAIVPDSVRALAGARVGELTGTARDVVLAASVLGTRFRRDVLAGLAGLEPGELAAALAAGRDTSLLQLAEPGEDRFRHDLVRDAIYDSIPADAREDLHTRAGGVLASLAERGRDVDDAEVAYHLARAGTAAAGPAAEYARRAGDRALAALAFEDAVHWYERAASSLAALRAGDDEQARAALRLGTARLAAGDLDGGRAGFRQAAERARRARRPDLLARAALGLGGGPAGFEVGLLDGEQISLLEEARSGLPDGQGTLIALVTARLSIASTLLLPEARRLELATEAVRQARSAGDDATLAATLAALCDAIAGPDHCAARRAHATEIIDLADRLRDPVLGPARAEAAAGRPAGDGCHRGLGGGCAGLPGRGRGAAPSAVPVVRPAVAGDARPGRGPGRRVPGRAGRGRRHRRAGGQRQRHHARADPAVVPARRGSATPLACWPCCPSWRRSRFPLPGSRSPGRSCWPRPAGPRTPALSWRRWCRCCPRWPGIRSGCPRWRRSPRPSR